MFGPPGSGKGTQSKMLCEKYNLSHISTGDIFRKEMSEGTELGKKVKDIVDRGELVPDELLIAIIRKAIKQNADKNGYIFDGFPRTVRQAEDFDKLMVELGLSLSTVLRLKVTDEEIIRRLSLRAELEGRKDDTIEVITNRLNVYREKTMPLLDYYREQNKMIEINGIGKMESIFELLSSKVNAFL
jgi:adenylate kinase